MSENIRDRCVVVISKFIENPDDMVKITNGAPLLGSGSLDSLSLVNLVVEIEAEFGISINSEGLEEVFSSFSSLVAYIESEISAQ